MRLTDLLWALAASVGVGCVLAAGKARESLEERQLNFDTLGSPIQRDHHNRFTPYDSHSRSLTLSPREDISLSNVVETEDHSVLHKPKPGRLTPKSKYPKVSKKKHQKKKNKNKRKHSSRRGHKRKGRLDFKPSLFSPAKHISAGERDSVTYHHNKLSGREEKPNEIVITSFQTPSKEDRRQRSGSFKSISTYSLKSIKPASRSSTISRGYPSFDISPPSSVTESTRPQSITSPLQNSSISEYSLKDIEPGSVAVTTEHPWLVTAPPPVSSLTLDAESGSSVDKPHTRIPTTKKYPYSTTFHNFDSFLNSIGTSFRIADDSHAIKPRSGKGKTKFEQADEPHVDDEDMYERNSLGIDASEQDRETLLKMPERCCGSKVPLDEDNAKATGAFDRVAAAGSIKVVEVPEEDSDLLPPSGVRDLKASVTGPTTIMLTWSAPGDDLDNGKVSRYVIRLSDTRYDLRERRFDQASSYMELDLEDLLQSSGVYQEANTKVKVTIDVDERIPVPLRRGQQYYLAFRSLDDFNNTSPVSNIATFTLPKIPQPSTTTPATTTSILPSTTTIASPPPPPPLATTTTTTTTTTPSTTTSTTVATTPPPPITSTEHSPYTQTSDSPSRYQPTRRPFIIATLEGRVVPSFPQDQTQNPRKQHKRKGKGRKKQRKPKKKRNKKQGSQDETSSEPTFDSSVYDRILANIHSLKDSF